MKNKANAELQAIHDQFVSAQGLHDPSLWIKIQRGEIDDIGIYSACESTYATFAESCKRAMSALSMEDKDPEDPEVIAWCRFVAIGLRHRLKSENYYAMGCAYISPDADERFSTSCTFADMSRESATIIAAFIREPRHHCLKCNRLEGPWGDHPHLFCERCESVFVQMGIRKLRDACENAEKILSLDFSDSDHSACQEIIYRLKWQAVGLMDLWPRRSEFSGFPAWPRRACTAEELQETVAATQVWLGVLPATRVEPPLQTNGPKLSFKDQALIMKKNAPNKSYRQIAKELGCDHTAFSRDPRMKKLAMLLQEDVQQGAIDQQQDSDGKATYKIEAIQEEIEEEKED